MAHIHQELVTINISKLVKGNHAECEDICVATPDVCQAIEAVIAEILGDDSLVVEVKHQHQTGEE